MNRKLGTWCCGFALMGFLVTFTMDVWASGITYRGCFNPKSGILRVVNDADACRPPETAIMWNAEGPQGPPGPSGNEALAAEIYGPCGRFGHLLSGSNPDGSPRCASASPHPSPKVVYQQIPVGTHEYDTSPLICPEGYKFIGGTIRGNPVGRLFSSGGAFNPDNFISGAYDNTYVDCDNPDGCVTICLRMTFY